jgi:hypothetical protein
MDGFGGDGEEVPELSDSVFPREQMARWVKDDAEGSLRWVSETLGSSPSPETLHAMAKWLVSQDSRLASAWGKTLASIPEREGVALFIAREVLRSDPVLALGVACEFSPGEKRDEFLRQALTEWGARDAGAAREWVGQIQDEALRFRLIACAAIGIATQRPEMAAAWVTREMPAGTEQNGAVISIIQRWAQSSPEKAAEWVAAFPEAPIQHAALKALLQSWTLRDPTSAMEWVSRLPSGAFKARASNCLQR